MSANEGQEKVKREYKYRRRPPVSEESKQTRRYANEVRRLYKGFFVVKDSATYVDEKTTLAHSCLICGSTEVVKPKTVLSGRGCSECKTTEEHMKLLADHIQRLKEVHDGQFELIGLPPRFTGASKEMHRCKECTGQFIVRPGAVLMPDFKCSFCEDNKNQKRQVRAYKNRLELLYGGQIRLTHRLNLHEPVSYTCSCNAQHPSMWVASIEEMLSGSGCPKCGNAVAMPKLVNPVMKRGKGFILRRSLEAKALNAISAEVPSLLDVETALTYPIPVIGKKHVPAYYLVKKNKLVDVTTLKLFDEARPRYVSRYRKAKKLGYEYALIVIDEKKDIVVMFNSEEWLASADKKLPLNLREDFVIGPKNVRCKTFKGEKEGKV